MRKSLLGLCIIFILIGWFYYTPFIAFNRINKAAHAGDAVQLSSDIDYPSLHASLETELTAIMLDGISKFSDKNNDTELSSYIEMVKHNISQAVDTLTTPKGIVMFFNNSVIIHKTSENHFQLDMGGSAPNGNKKADETKHSLERKAQYESLNHFVMTISDPISPHIQTRFHLVRDSNNLTKWTLTHIEIPKT
jgi:hypothetical protein